MSTNDLETWFLMIDHSGQNKPPFDVRAKDKDAAKKAAVRQWYGDLPGCCLESVFSKIVAVPYTADGRITKIEGIEGLPASACLPPSNWSGDKPLA